MGGLFSSPDIYPQRQYQQERLAYWTTEERPSYSTSSSYSTSTRHSYGNNNNNNNNVDIEENFLRTIINPQLRQIDDVVQLPVEQITRSPIFDYCEFTNVVSYTLLNQNDLDYSKIRRMIKNRCIKIDRIYEVRNEFLKKSYQLKNEEKQERFGSGTKERLLFHATSCDNALKICKYNFDWRLCVRHRFGKGVCFSINAKYAADSAAHLDKNSDQKAMIVAKVSIFKSHEGNSATVLPYDGYDTTDKNDDIVLVKYEDAEFYPAYLIYYTMKPQTRRVYS